MEVFLRKYFIGRKGTLKSESFCAFSPLRQNALLSVLKREWRRRSFLSDSKMGGVIVIIYFAKRNIFHREKSKSP